MGGEAGEKAYKFDRVIVLRERKREEGKGLLGSSSGGNLWLRRAHASARSLCANNKIEMEIASLLLRREDAFQPSHTYAIPYLSLSTTLSADRM